MNDIILEVVRVIPITIILIYLILAGRKLKQQNEIGWKYIIMGFGLILFASIIDITDNFENLNKFVVIGDTEIQAFLEKVVGYLSGFVLLAAGFWKWLPKIVKLNQTQQELELSKKKLQTLNVSLEKKILEKTKELQKSKNDLELKNKDLEKFNKMAVGRELKMTELKKKIKELENK